MINQVQCGAVGNWHESTAPQQRVYSLESYTPIWPLDLLLNYFLVISRFEITRTKVYLTNPTQRRTQKCKITNERGFESHWTHFSGSSIFSFFFSKVQKTIITSCQMKICMTSVTQRVRVCVECVRACACGCADCLMQLRPVNTFLCIIKFKS